MRVALFGGTFDPIHWAHLRVARASAEVFALDRVLFAPTGRQPLKPDGAAASFEDRVAMVAVALEDQAKEARDEDRRCVFEVTELDAPRPDGKPNYTVDVLTEVARAMAGAELFAIAGGDSFVTLPRWRSPERVLELAEWIVVSRSGLAQTQDFLDRPEFAALALTTAERARIHLLPGVHEDIAATGVRESLREHPGSGSAGLLPPGVARYIEERGLYRKTAVDSAHGRA